jgi:hypothetical protein
LRLSEKVVARSVSSDWSVWLSGSRWRGRFGYGQVVVSIVAKSRLAHVQLQVTLT